MPCNAMRLSRPEHAYGHSFARSAHQRTPHGGAVETDRVSQEACIARQGAPGPPRPATNESWWDRFGDEQYMTLRRCLADADVRSVLAESRQLTILHREAGRRIRRQRRAVSGLADRLGETLAGRAVLETGVGAPAFRRTNPQLRRSTGRASTSAPPSRVRPAVRVAAIGGPARSGRSRSGR